MDKEEDITDEEIYFLIQSMRDTEAEACAQTKETYVESYTAVVQALLRKYNRPRANYLLHFKSFLTPQKGDYARHSMEELVKQFNQICRGIIHSKGYSVEQLLGVQLESAFSPKLKHEGTVASEDIYVPPTLDELLEFLEKHLLNLPNDGANPITTTSGSTSSNSSTVRKARVSQVWLNNKQVCSSCHNEKHIIFQCSQFREKTPEQRQQTVKELGLCFNCLHPNNNIALCNSKWRCKTCREHITLSCTTAPPTQTQHAAMLYRKMLKLLKTFQLQCLLRYDRRQPAAEDTSSSILALKCL